MNSEQHITNLLIAINQTQWCLCRFCERGPILIETFISIALLFPFHRFLSLFISISLCWIDIIYLHLYLPLSVYVSVSLSLSTPLSLRLPLRLCFSLSISISVSNQKSVERENVEKEHATQLWTAVMLKTFKTMTTISFSGCH